MNEAPLADWLRRRFVIAWIAGAAMWLVWVVSVALGGGRYDYVGQLLGADHMAFYSAAHLIADGRGAHLYDYEYLSGYQAQLAGPPWNGLDAYRNPPFYALLYLPTARLDYVASVWIWTAVALLCLWFGLRGLGASNVPLAFLWSLTFYPVFATVTFGQNTLLSFGIFCLTFYLLDRGRPFAAGLAAGLLLYKPQLLLGLGLWWLFGFRRYLWCWAGLCVTGLALLAVSLIFVPNETRDFVESLPRIAKYDAFWFYNLHNPRGFGTMLFGDDKQIGNVFGMVGLVLGAIAFAWFWRRHRDDVPLTFAAAVFVTLWASPHTMVYEWALAVIPAVLLWERVPQKRDAWVVLFGVVWAVMFVATPLSEYPFRHWGFAVQISVPVLAAVAVLAARELERVRGRRLSENAEEVGAKSG